jgi:phage baseplate assembly protein W
MTYTIDFSDGVDLAIIPESEDAATMQNLYCLINTTLAEVPCYREYGINKEFLSKPIQAAKTMLVVAVAEALEKFFPEKKIKNVTFKVDGDYPDKLMPRFEVVDDE